MLNHVQKTLSSNENNQADINKQERFMKKNKLKFQSDFIALKSTIIYLKL